MKIALTKGQMVDQLKTWGIRKGIKEGVGEVPLEHLKSHDIVNLWSVEYNRRKEMESVFNLNITITGDVHGSVDFLKLTPSFMPHISINVDPYDIDIMFICGDAGFIWDGGLDDQMIKEEIEKLPYTLLCVLGNHENYDIINKIPITDWNGIKVRQIAKNCFYLVSPQVFILDGKKYFIMNGATSIDKKYRTEHISWWRDEIPTERSFELAKQLLLDNEYKVDYIITHCSPTKIIYKLFPNPIKEGIDKLTDFYDWVDSVVLYKKWYMGHLHFTETFEDKNGYKRMLYNFVELIN